MTYEMKSSCALGLTGPFRAIFLACTIFLIIHGIHGFHGFMDPWIHGCAATTLLGSGKIQFFISICMQLSDATQFSVFQFQISSYLPVLSMFDHLENGGT